MSVSSGAGAGSEGVAWMPRGWRPSPNLQRAVLDLLHDRIPPVDFSKTEIEGCLRRYECGGWIRGRWASAGRLDHLPEQWRQPLDRLHRRMRIDNLAALAEFRRLGRLLRDEGIPILLLKGADYLTDLYEDPAARFLTDIDILVRPEDVGRMARMLRGHGYQADLGENYPEHRRFEMWRPTEGHCRFEIHWQLGIKSRVRIDQRAIWERARVCKLEDVTCHRLGDVDDALYHVFHQASHYYGPTIKWVLDLRLMFMHRELSEDRLFACSAGWKVRTALHIALIHLERIFPGTVSTEFVSELRPGRVRRDALQSRLLDEPIEIMRGRTEDSARYALRFLLTDRSTDGIALMIKALARPIVRPIQRLLGAARPPWER